MKTFSMIHIPEIVNYNPFIQSNADEVAMDTREWGLVAKVNPYPLLPKPKDLHTTTGGMTSMGRG